LSFTGDFSKRQGVPQDFEMWRRWNRPSLSPRRRSRVRVEKAAALCFSLVENHPFVDGNKRLGHAAMETFVILNGAELDAGVDDQERVMLDLAAGASGSQLQRHVRRCSRCSLETAES
jgi:prophage maintenance system killer protein